MLGRFLEFSIVTPDIRASLEFYTRLGFSEAQTGEAWTHPYAVLTDGRVCLGLHQLSTFAPSITFVKPDLLKHLESLERLGLPFEFRHLANDRFNELGWPDPSGHFIRLVEARTFSPSKRRSTDTSLCGYFSEIALPAPDLDAAKVHWEQLGFVGVDEPDAIPPRVSCTSDTLDIGLYEPALQERALVFEVDELDVTLKRLDAAGTAPAGRPPAPLRQAGAVMLMAPEGTRIVIRRSAPNTLGA